MVVKFQSHLFSSIFHAFTMKDGMWTGMRYHVVLNNPVSEVNRCEKRVFMSQRLGLLQANPYREFQA